MKRIFFLVLTLFILNLSPVNLFAEVDFVELKKKEEERRKKTKKSKAVVNLEYIKKIKQKKEKYALFQIEPSIKFVEKKGKGSEGKGPGSKRGAEGKDPTKTKGYWQGLKNSLQGNIIKLEEVIKKQQLQLNKLHDDHIITDLPEEKDALKAEVDKLSDILKNNKIRLDVLRKDLESLYERARRAGIPPGWVR